MLGFLKNIGPIEWLIVAFILVVLFGGKIVKMLGKTSGETVKEVKKIKKTFTEAMEDEDEADKEDK